MTTTVEDVAAKLRSYSGDGRIRTHSENCWQWHPECAMMLAASILDTVPLLTEVYEAAYDVCPTFGELTADTPLARGINRLRRAVVALDA